jgi:hypothetical protein
MEPMTGLMLTSLALGAAGGASNFIGGRKEAKRKQAAIDQYNRDSKRVFRRLEDDAWDAGFERQRGTGSVIQGLTPAMTAAPSAVPSVAASLPSDTAPQASDRYREALALMTAPKVALAQKQAKATQSGIDRATLMHVLNALGYSSGVEASAKAPQHSRTRHGLQLELEEAKRRLDDVLGSTGNATRNLQLLGSLFNTGSQAAMMGAAFSGGPKAPGAVDPMAGHQVVGLANM